jgi:hypothetical protein
LHDRGHGISQLAERLVEELRQLQQSGQSEFPLTVRELATRLSATDSSLIFQSLGKRTFTDHAVVVLSNRSKKHKDRRLDAFVCLKDDVPQLAATDELLRFVMELACRSKAKLFTPTQLSGQLTGARQVDKVFQQTLNARLKDNSLPVGLGSLAGTNTTYVFRLADIQTTIRADASHSISEPLTSPSEPAARPDFAALFAEAFLRLDREQGSHNFVKIADLRRALPQFDRAAFDAGLWQLRKHNLFTADSSDGNYEQLMPEERAAGIREGDSLLIYVSRK